VTEKDFNAIMTKTRIFSGFTQNECAVLRELSQAAMRSCADSETLISEGAIVDFFVIVLRGNLICEKNDYGGRVELIQNFAPGDTVCLDIACTLTRRCPPFRIICANNAELLVFRYDALFCRDILPDDMYERLRSNVIYFLANENIKQLYKIDVLYKRSLREKILVFLRNMAARTGSNTLYIHMNREQFAQYLGVNRSSLSHELSLMQAEGLFRFKKDCFVLEEQKPPEPSADEPSDDEPKVDEPNAD
jgi:CRP-like cAMP-binding protein